MLTQGEAWISSGTENRDVRLVGSLWILEKGREALKAQRQETFVTDSGRDWRAAHRLQTVPPHNPPMGTHTPTAQALPAFHLDRFLWSWQVIPTLLARRSQDSDYQHRSDY